MKLATPSIPHLVHIETTYACNARCIFCYNPSRTFEINYKRLDKIVSSVKKSEIPHVYLIGGEPSLLKQSKLNEYIENLSSTSSVTLVTNGLKYIDNLSNDLACIGIPLHGTKEIHEYVTGVEGGYKKVIKSIEKYVSRGFDVRCIPVLMSLNYNQMYETIKKAFELGMESVYIDCFESGGIGSKLAEKLKPSLQQFKEALTQIIKAKKDFGIKVGFGTALPFCLDERLFKEDLLGDCGAGFTFAAIDPWGNVRICNQSTIIYGNVLKEPLEKIWKKNRINIEFRCLKWVSEPCKSCKLLHYCLGGCKVDTNFPGEYSVDPLIRNKRPPLSPEKVFKLFKEWERKKEEKWYYPPKFRRFKIEKYTKLILKHKEKYLVTRYQTIVVNSAALKILKFLLNKRDKVWDEKELLIKFRSSVYGEEMRKFVSQLERAGAIRVL